MPLEFLSFTENHRVKTCQLIERCRIEFKFSLEMKNKQNPESEKSWNVSSTTAQEMELVDEEELNSINQQLDQLSSALDQLEQRNESIQAQLVQLLQSNREARKQFQEMRNQSNPSDKKENHSTT